MVFFCCCFFFCFISLSKETGLDPEKMKLICKGHVIEDGMYQVEEVAIKERIKKIKADCMHQSARN